MRICQSECICRVSKIYAKIRKRENEINEYETQLVLVGRKWEDFQKIHLQDQRTQRRKGKPIAQHSLIWFTFCENTRKKNGTGFTKIINKKIKWYS